MRLPKIPRIPRVKDIRSKLASARLLGGVAKNSIMFKLKRRALRRFRSREFDTIIVDMDGTLYDTDANLESLIYLYPEKNEEGKTAGEDLYDSIISKIASGQYSIERAIVEGNKFLVARKMSRADFLAVLARIRPTLRLPLVDALKKIRGGGKTLVLATLSSKDFGDMLNSGLKKRFGLEFDLVVGTEMNFDSENKICGIRSMVGTKDFRYGGIPVNTKLSAIRDGMELIGREFDVKKSVLITDSYSDIDIAQALTTILVKPENPTIAQKVSQRLKLADYILADDEDLGTNLESIVLGPEK